MGRDEHVIRADRRACALQFRSNASVKLIRRRLEFGNRKLVKESPCIHSAGPVRILGDAVPQFTCHNDAGEAGAEVCQIAIRGPSGRIA
jgi:hypothetical protein